MSEAVWNRVAWVYHGMRQNPISAKILSEENAAAKQLLATLDFSTIQRALDVGTGIGNALGFIVGFVAQITAVDSSSEMLQAAKIQFPTVHFVHADALNLPFKTASFELVLCVGVSEYVPNVSSLLKELHRMLAPSGVLLFTSATKSPLNWLRYALGHWLFLRDALGREVQEVGFEIITTSQTMLQRQYLLRKP